MFSNTVELNWVVGYQAPTGKRSVDLNPFEFGILSTDTWLTVPFGSAATQEVVLAVGSPNNPQATDGQRINRTFNPLNTDISFKSDPLGRVKALRFFEPKKEDLEQVYYLGYNGLDSCQSLNFECGKTYDFHLNLKGRAVRSVLGREFNEIVSIDAPCCDESCGCVDGKVDCSLVIDQLVERFKTDIFWVNRFFDVEKVMSCTPSLPEPTKTNYTKYCLTVCDNGDELALSEVQRQYPSVTVTVKERNAPYTTYEMVQLASAQAPTAFSQQETVLKGCATCPSGFTQVASGFQYIVEIDNAGTDTTSGAQLTAVQTIWGTATFAQKINFNYGTSTYYITTSATIADSGEGRVVRPLGSTDLTCRRTTAVTTGWITCGTWYKVQRELCLTKQNDDCKSNPEELSLVSASLNGRTDVVPNTLVLDADSTNCVIRFRVSQYNNALLQDGCDTYGSDGAKFDDLPDFQGFRWEVCPCEGWTVNGNGCPVPPTPTDRCCQCGLKFTTKVWQEDFLDQIWDINEFDNTDPIDLNVSLYLPDGQLAPCTTNIPLFRKVKGITLRALKGRDVIKQILITRFDRKEKFLNATDKQGLLFLQREGIKYGIDFDAYYFKIEVSHEKLGMNRFSPVGNIETVSLYIHENNAALFESLKGQLTGAFPTVRVEQY